MPRPQTLSRPSRSRKPNVGSGSKIDVQTVLKLIDDAITATYASSGASSGSATSPTWSDLRGSLSADSTPSNIPTSSRRTKAARYVSGKGRESEVVAPRSLDDGVEDRAHGHRR